MGRNSPTISGYIPSLSKLAARLAKPPSDLSKSLSLPLALLRSFLPLFDLNQYTNTDFVIFFYDLNESHRKTLFHYLVGVTTTCTLSCALPFPEYHDSKGHLWDAVVQK
jgi:hypothetical protein